MNRTVSYSALGLVIVVSTLLGCGSSSNNFSTVATNNVVTCNVARKECVIVGPFDTCNSPENNVFHNFKGTVCKNDYDSSNLAACQRAFCGPSPLYTNCSTSEETTSSAIKSLNDGICKEMSYTHYGNVHRASVNYKQRFWKCAQSTGQCGALIGDGSGDANYVSPSDSPHCIDVSRYPAWSLLQPTFVDPTATTNPLGRIMLPSVEITQFKLNDSSCPLLTDPSPTAQNYYVQKASPTVISAGSMSIPLSVTNGSASISNSCPTTPAPDASTPPPEPDPSGTTYDPPPGAPVATPCGDVLQSAEASFADVSVNGAAITGLSVRSIATAPITASATGSGVIGAGKMLLAVSARVNGTPNLVVVPNSTPWTVNKSGGQLALQGNVDLVTTGFDGSGMVVSAAVTLNANTATQQQVACANATPVQQLFGFEDRAQWTSTNATLEYGDSPVTQGCGALKVSGQGYMTINGARFSTTGLATDSALSVDLYVPTGQPNPWWTGALQMYLTCPSDNVFNQYIGQVDLTGKPEGAFSTLRFPLPSQTLATLNKPLADCSFSLALNVNNVSNAWVLDNLRFTP